MNKQEKSIQSDLVFSISKLSDRNISRVILGERLNAVQTQGIGLASAMQKRYTSEKVDDFNQPTAELARYFLSNNPNKASIGLATINSLLAVRIKGVVERNAVDLILKKGRGKNVAVIGHFPFVDKLRQQLDHLSVFELEPGAGDLPAAKMKYYLPSCNVVALTATVLLNGTFKDVHKLCPVSAYKIMLGPSTPLSPVLWDYGFDALGGCIVSDVQTTLNAVRTGASFRDLNARRILMLKKEMGLPMPPY